MPQPLAPRETLRSSLRTLMRSSRIWLGLPLLIFTACGGSTITDSTWGSTGLPARVLPPPPWYSAWATEQSKLNPDPLHMARTRAARLIWEAQSAGDSVDMLIADCDEATLAQAGQMIIDSIGYEEIMRRAEEKGWVKRVPVEQSLSAAAKRFIGDVPPSTTAIVEEAFTWVMTKTAPVALTVSQLDTPAPGYGDLVAVGIFAVSLVAVGGISVYIYVTREDAPVPTPQPQPQPAPQPAPRKSCPVCSPYPKGNMGYLGPHSDHDHHPVGRPHLNLFVVNQNPQTCNCFWNKNNPDAVSPPPLPGWVNLNDGFPPLSP